MRRPDAGHLALAVLIGCGLIGTHIVAVLSIALWGAVR